VEERRTVLEYQRPPVVEKPVTWGMVLGVILFYVGVLACFAMLIYVIALDKP
jgi:hypothetical protein